MIQVKINSLERKIDNPLVRLIKKREKDQINNIKNEYITMHVVVIVAQSPSHAWFFVTSWTAAWQACLSLTISQSLSKFMSIASVIPSNHLILWRHLLLLSIFPSIRVFSNKSAVHIRWPKYCTSASASVLPMSIQGWFPFRLTGLIPLLSKGLS